MHGDDVGVRDASHRLGLAQESGRAGFFARGGAEQFEGDSAVELWIIGGVDDAHSAGPDLVQHHVPAEGLAAFGKRRRVLRPRGLEAVDPGIGGGV